jgi:pyridoxal phosphate enzyme (YggS family)
VGPAIEIVAVTKSLPVEAWHVARAAGCDAVGENYAQELREKHDRAAESGQPVLPDVHFIGGIQTNKVRLVADIVALWQTVDRESVVREIAKRAPGARILLQVNTTGEDSKSGCAPEDLGRLLDTAASSGLSCEGLMTIGPTSGETGSTRESFRLLRRLVDAHGLSRCSMGMSGDYRIAVEEGATMIRLGTVLFGPRSPRPSGP